MDEPQAIGTGAGRGRVEGAAAAAAVAAALAAAIVWSFYPNFKYLAGWWEDSNYSHGWLIVPIALFILWQRRDSRPPADARHRWWNFLPLALLLALRVWLYDHNEQWIEAATVPLVIAATVLAVGGWGTFRWALPGLIYLVFMVPLPPSVNEYLAAPLQRLATRGSIEVLTSIGKTAVAEGNVIHLGTQRVEVAEACRGLSMLLSFGALITAMVIIVRRPIWERIVLIASIIPIALLCNIIRISITAVAYDYFNKPVHEVHDYAGFAMMALALGIVLLELKVMGWVVVEERRDAEEPPPSPLRPKGPR